MPSYLGLAVFLELKTDAQTLNHQNPTFFLSIRYAYPWWRDKEIDSKTKRSEGLCPLTPEEASLVLKALGFEKDTLIYIAAGEIYGGEKRLKPLRAAFPKLVSVSNTLSTTLASSCFMEITTVQFLTIHCK